MESTQDRVILSREVQAVQIPNGSTVALAQGAEVMITQSLGGTFTVHSMNPPGLFRIANADADALGLTASPEETPQDSSEFCEQLIWDTLKTCYDPEIPVNIVDLGLIYSMQHVAAVDGKTRVEVKMTLTASGCGMGPAIAEDARQKLLTLQGVSEAQVDIVWEPPWTPALISPEGKAKLGIES